nr:laccase domain-containing protein [Propionibacterium freudenreichii]
MFSYLREPTPRGVGDVGVAFTDRRGGVSVGGFRSLNFGRTDVDELAVLRTNMSLLRARLGIAPLQTVHQVHGTMIATSIGSMTSRALRAGWVTWSPVVLPCRSPTPSCARCPTCPWPFGWPTAFPWCWPMCTPG